MTEDTKQIQIAADVGGTFTDVVVMNSDGRVLTRKVPSTPPDFETGVLNAIDDVLADRSVAPETVATVCHGTTVATNAILEKRGAKTALITTRGFRDVFELRRLRAPQLYDLFFVKPSAMVDRYLRFEVNERMSADGDVLVPLDTADLDLIIARLQAESVESVAVCYLHSYAFPEHERRTGDYLRERIPDIPVSLSHAVLRQRREYERTATTVVNAYVRPVMHQYLERLGDGLIERSITAPLLIMQSAGGLTPADGAARNPVFALESGPAAGVLAAAHAGKTVDLQNLISFDMGGTTAKVAIIEGGEIPYSAEYEVGASLSAGNRLTGGGGELILAPTIAIAEVGAGGGSIAAIDSAGALKVGPRSAGALPGPVCYQRGGTEPTVTDANVVLGYIRPGELAGGDVCVDAAAAESAVRDRIGMPLGLETLTAALGVHDIANATMLRALREVSVYRGRDPRDFVLVAFGGSGPIHAANLAGELGITRVLVPPMPGVFSAVGLLVSGIEHHDVRSCQLAGDSLDSKVIMMLLDDMRDAMLLQFAAESVARETIVLDASADVRFVGEASQIRVPLRSSDIDAPAVAQLCNDFEAEHNRLYGHAGDRNSVIEVCAVRVRGRESVERHGHGQAINEPAAGATARPAMFHGMDSKIDVPIVVRAELQAPRTGPLFVDEYDATIVVPPGWTAHTDTQNNIIMDRDNPVRPLAATKDPNSIIMTATQKPDPITLEIVGNALASTADVMAVGLYRTAFSTIVRDALDFSTSLCDACGRQIAQGTTIPLHMGAVPTAMASLFAKFADAIEPGDVFILNDPFDGGMHIPDIFIIKPVFAGDQRVAFAVSTAHHLDLGGRVPGSSACDNRDIFQDGFRIPMMKLYDRGEPNETLFNLLRANIRVPDMTLGDLRGQLSACYTGEQAVLELVERHGIEMFENCAAALIDYSERLVRSEIQSWPDSTSTFIDYMDSDGCGGPRVKIKCQMTVAGDELTADFTGSDLQVPGAINATMSYTVAAVGFAMRAAMHEMVPNTEGMFRPLTVIAPPGTVMNVEMPGASSMRGVTGFRLVDAALGALAGIVPDRIPAACEGGNSLVIIGGQRPESKAAYVYYELICGTWGARPDRDGNDGLCSPANVAANIPIEEAECNYPVRIERYGLANDSGGAGQYRGGMAVEREWTLLAGESQLTIRSDRRDHPPYGLFGGQSGRGSTSILRSGGCETELPTMISRPMHAGDSLYHRQPAGGGYGNPLLRDPEAVAWDVKNDRVSRQSARDDYGVILHPQSFDVDYVATAAARRE